MTIPPLSLSGLWLPLITPFQNGALDLTSLRRLVTHYQTQPIDGLVLAGTTGEAPALSDDEIATIVATVEEQQTKSGTRIPVILGVMGSSTQAVADRLRAVQRLPIDGYLISSPFYSRPSQAGMLAHFNALAEATARPIVLYNIPYRTGVNLSNDTMLELATLPNVIGLKDCGTDAEQSLDLLLRRPEDFRVMTGEDAGYFPALCAGVDGAILSAAHILTEDFAQIGKDLRTGNLQVARDKWSRLHGIAKLLFAEPSPGAVKHWLWRSGLIDSPELRLPMTRVSSGLAAQIDRIHAELSH